MMAQPTHDAAVGPAAIRWGRPSHAFELRSRHREVLDRAHTVFGRWHQAPGDEPASAAWDVARTSEGWEVRSDHDCAHYRSVDRAVTAVEFGAVLALHASTTALLAHAALLERDGRALLILGPSGAGKSTLACALWQRGFALLADDGAIIDAAGVTAAPVPRRVSVRASSRELLGDRCWAHILDSTALEQTPEGYLFHPPSSHVNQAGVRISGCVFLERTGAPRDTLLSPITPAHAVFALLPYLNLAAHLEPGAVIARVAPLASAVSMVDLARGPVAVMADTVERWLGEQS